MNKQRYYVSLKFFATSFACAVPCEDFFFFFWLKSEQCKPAGFTFVCYLQS